LPTERILKEVRTLVAAGYQEIVLSGINLGRWGRDLAGNASFLRGRRMPSFEGLIRAILEETAIAKLRISSVEPMDWSDELIGLVAASSRIARHAHVPMQSGSDRILRRMHRKYRPKHYVEKILKIRAAMPDAAIGADVMVGFPGETEADFEETRRLVEDLPFTYLHVFTYSARPGTPAASFCVQIPEPVARKRNQILRNLAARKKHSFMQSFAGKTIAAITLGRGAGTRLNTEAVAWTEALTDNYLKLRLRGIHSPNRWWNARVTAVTNDTLVGEPVSPSVL
jgi:threonylcarbamoyladenosine tRNA methylthiotransferase MtaB